MNVGASSVIVKSDGSFAALVTVHEATQNMSSLSGFVPFLLSGNTGGTTPATRGLLAAVRSWLTQLTI